MQNATMHRLHRCDNDNRPMILDDGRAPCGVCAGTGGTKHSHHGICKVCHGERWAQTCTAQEPARGT